MFLALITENVMTHTISVFCTLVTLLIAPTQAFAWTMQPASSSASETWLIGADASGVLKICDTTSNTFVAWPASPIPTSPLTDSGTINMRGGNDFLRIVTNDGPYDCGYMYRIQYGSFQLTLAGGSGNDQIIGGSGVDNIFGDSADIDVCLEDSGGDDYLASGGGADVIHGCGGDDTFDTYYSPGAGTQVYGDWGEDCLESVAGVTLWCGDAISPYTDGYPDAAGASAVGCPSSEDTITALLVCS